MKARQVLLFAAFVAAPFAASAESPSERIFNFQDAQSLRTRAEVRAEAIQYALAPNLGEALGAFDMMAVLKSMRTREDVRRELALMPPELLKDGGGAN